jgi:hypothetical protein
MDEDEIIVALDIIRSYNGAMATRLRLKKYRASGVRSCDTSLPEKNLSYYQGITILGLTVVRTSNILSTLAKRTVEDRTRDSYNRDLCPQQQEKGETYVSPFSYFVCGTSVFHAAKTN